LMATDGKGGRVLAIGRAASQLVGRGGKARSVRPVRDGNGVDYGVAGAMLQHLIGRIVGRQRIFRPDVMLSVGPMVTGVERRAVLEATMQAGAKTAYLIDKPMAAAIGAKVAVSTTDGIVVVNLGAGSTEMAVIVLGEIVAMQSIPIGGEALDRPSRHRSPGPAAHNSSQAMPSASSSRSDRRSFLSTRRRSSSTAIAMGAAPRFASRAAKSRRPSRSRSRPSLPVSSACWPRSRRRGAPRSTATDWCSPEAAPNCPGWRSF